MTKALTFGLVDPDLEALIKDPNTIAYKTGTLVGEFGAGIAAFFINPVSGVGAVVTTTGKVVQVGAAAAKAIIASSAAKAAVSDVIQFVNSNGNSSSGKANPNGTKVNIGQQDKHISGTNNYNQSVANGKNPSILSENPQQLLDDFAGTGQKIPNTNKERVDFGKIIGQYYDDITGTYVNTTKGIIHYDSKGGAHIVPARP